MNPGDRVAWDVNNVPAGTHTAQIQVSVLNGSWTNNITFTFSGSSTFLFLNVHADEIAGVRYRLRTTIDGVTYTSAPSTPTVTAPVTPPSLPSNYRRYVGWSSNSIPSTSELANYSTSSNISVPAGGGTPNTDYLLIAIPQAAPTPSYYEVPAMPNVNRFSADIIMSSTTLRLNDGSGTIRTYDVYYDFVGTANILEAFNVTFR